MARYRTTRRIACWIVICGMLAAAEAQEKPVPAPNWTTPKPFKELAPHPRLFVSAEQIQRMVKGRGEDYAETYETVAAAAETGVRDAENPMKEISPFGRGFQIQGRLTSLAIQYHRTKDRRYLEAALKNVLGMEDWLQPMREFSLRHGQFIAAVAVAYDLLHNDLTPEERSAMVAFARDHCIRPFLRVTARGKNLKTDGERGSWWQHIISNWNPVCNSGAGMLALVMYEDLDEAQTVIDRVDASFRPIIDYLQETEGGWVEGLGYWNWTIHYMSLFLISYERTTGQEHAGFRSPGFRQTLTFGQYFVPHDEACGFGDNQHGGISSSLLAAAEHLGYKDVVKCLQDYLERRDAARALKKERRGEQEEAPTPEEDGTVKVVNISYGEPQRLLIHPDPRPEVASPEPVRNVTHSFPKQGWSMIADRWPKPTVYASVRGGELGGAHTHDDLLSWHGVVGIERMIHNICKAGYYDTSWQSRAKEIFERGTASANTLFIGGLSAFSGNHRRRGRPASAKTSHHLLPSGPALRLEATRAFDLTRRNPRLVCRLFAVLGDRGLLVLDRVEMPGRNPVEVRTYTAKEATFGETDVLLKGEFETARMTFAADRPAVLRRATALLTDGRAKPPTMMRWQTLGNVGRVTLASLLTRGGEKVELKVESDDQHVTVAATSEDWKETVRLTHKLEPREKQ